MLLTIIEKKDELTLYKYLIKKKKIKQVRGVNKKGLVEMTFGIKNKIKIELK